MTPNQKKLREIATLFDLIEKARSAPAEPVSREAVEVVGAVALGGIFHGGSGPELGDIDLELNLDVLERIQQEVVTSSDDVMLPLMTVDQHNRIVEALAPPSPDAELVELLRECRGIVAREVERWNKVAAFLLEDGSVKSGLLARIDAKLASLK